MPVTMTLDDLFLLTLKDIYFAERQVLKSLRKMSKAAENAELKQAFTAKQRAKVSRFLG